MMNAGRAQIIGRFTPLEGEELRLALEKKDSEGRITIGDAIQKILVLSGEYIALQDAVTSGVLKSYAPGSCKPLAGDLGNVSLDEEIYWDDVVELLAKEFPRLILTPPASKGGTSKKWTDERLAELAAYRAIHTMPETAAEFCITEQRIRQLLPSKKPKPSPLPGVIYRSK